MRARPLAGYTRQDSAASLSMGVGSVVVNLGARALALLGYTALYAVTPLRLDPHDWWTWVIALLLVDLLWYAYHRSSHRIRLLWAMHQAHHSSVHFNYTTALRQKWNPWGELLFWVPLPLVGLPPWMIFFVFSLNLTTSSGCTPRRSPSSGDRSSWSSTRRPTTACTTPATPSTSTATTAAS